MKSKLSKFFGILVHGKSLKVIGVESVKCLLAAAGLFVASPAAAGLFDSATNLVAQTLRSDGTTNSWTGADLSDALGLINRYYWREMATRSGRGRWHGSLVSVTTVTNAARWYQVERYADGFEYRDEANGGRVLTADEQAEALIKAERAEADRRERAASRIPSLRAEISGLEAAVALGLAADATDAEREAYGRKLIDLTAKKRLLLRCEAAAAETNVVTAVVSPE